MRAEYNFSTLKVKRHGIDPRVYEQAAERFRALVRGFPTETREGIERTLKDAPVGPYPSNDVVRAMHHLQLWPSPELVNPERDAEPFALNVLKFAREYLGVDTPRKLRRLNLELKHLLDNEPTALSGKGCRGKINSEDGQTMKQHEPHVDRLLAKIRRLPAE